MNKRNWIASIALLGAIDWYAAFIRKDGTLSQAARETFRTDTRYGRVAWATTWTVLSVWLIKHIWDWPEDGLSS